MSIFQSSLSNDLGFLKILATLERYGDLIIGFLTFNMPYLPNIRSLGPPDGTEEATEIHWPGPDNLIEGGDFLWT